MTLSRPDLTIAPPTFADAAEAHLDDVFGYLLHLTRNRAAADDLCGATFEKALHLWPRFDVRRGTPRTWLLEIARSTALDWFRSEKRRRRREEVSAPLDRVEDPVVDGLSAELEHALASLSPAEREVVALRVVLELDGAATARLLGITPTAVSTRLSRALERLEERMSEHELG